MSELLNETGPAVVCAERHLPGGGVLLPDRTCAAAMSEPKDDHAKASRIALANALLLPRVGDPPPPPPPQPPPGWVTFSTLCRRTIVAAFGEAIYRDAFATFGRWDRIREAVEAHDRRQAAGRQQTPHPLGFGLLSAVAATQPTGRRGLLSRVPLAPPASPEEEQARALAERKADRARARLHRLTTEAQAQTYRLSYALELVYSFLFSLGRRRALQADTIDDSDRVRAVTREAWEDYENLELLRKKRQFRAGTEGFDKPGTLCFPEATADALVSFVAEHGEAALSNIAGAVRSVGGAVPEPTHQWASAADWFREEGEAKIRATLMAQALCTEGEVKRQAASRWNCMDDSLKAPGAKRIVTAGAFKYAAKRSPKSAARGHT